MSKKYFFGVFLFLLFLGGLKFSSALEGMLLDISDPIKRWYLNVTESLQTGASRFVDQQELIEKLKEENARLKSYKLRLKAALRELEEMSQSCNTSTSFLLDVKLVRALSYVRLGDFSRLWIEFDDFNSSKIYGLIKDDYAAGIVTSQNGRPMALLNTNRKCAYAVEIGEVKAPGIATGRRDGTMTVKFIPMHKEIKIGDEVVTSGMDNIFFYGVKVGVVEKIKTRGSYKVAVIRPYAETLDSRYFWVVLKSYE